MSLWSSLSVGVTGLQTGSNALNTVAHNLTNVDTDGYTRQQVEQADRIYTTLSKTASKISYQQVGLGVYYSNVKQVRDYFLDKTYRQEVGREDFYSVSSGTLNEVEDLLGELQGTQFQKSLSDLWTSVQELTKDPCNSVTMGAFVSEANEFLFRAQGVYDGLSSFQDNLNYQVKQKVNQINELGKSLLKLNDEIRNVELGGVEHANDLRDERNLILDKLAELADISYREDYFGNAEVQIEGEDFVKGGVCYEIGLKTDNLTGFYTPFWPQNAEWHLDDMGNRDYDIENALVFDLSRQISSELNTDIGGLKSILLARGDHRADYTDIETNPETGESNYDNISQSVLMNIQAEFDQLVHNTMRAINSVLEDAAGVKSIADGSGDAQTQALYDALKAGDEANGDYYDGKTYKLVKASDLTYMKDNDGSPLLLFKKQTTDSYEK
ncbi:MAG: flagellar hook-associated protein FlgK, partial [Lachnospiraceae bacterium]|nr:flagellar hook-associated protein FlgK [Lachnospiraceae bacterium]